ncbi:MAG: extracellular solute-binding protein family 1 [Gemmatimonadetes bacterium]|nr:extracellular solute-binding protein family 1 [Gemmatimonadota bacterium]
MDNGRLRATLALLLLACAQPGERAPSAARDTVVVFSASSLALPLRSVLDSFARRTNAVVQQENGASLDLARRITELDRTPDLVVLADQEVFPELLVPSATSWYARFARNRMVIAYTDRSRGAAELSERSWRRILLRPDVLVGRGDPTLAPAGYRALLVYRLAERFYREPGLAQQLAARTPPRLMRGNASELAALLSAGELDYIVDYESLAKANGLRYLKLPGAIDLGDPALASDYARDTVRVIQRSGAVARVGAPITYAASVPRAAPHRDAGIRALAFLLGAEGRALLRARSVDALDAPELVGDSVPLPIRRVATP